MSRPESRCEWRSGGCTTPMTRLPGRIATGANALWKHGMLSGSYSRLRGWWLRFGFCEVRCLTLRLAPSGWGLRFWQRCFLRLCFFAVPMTPKGSRNINQHQHRVHPQGAHKNPAGVRFFNRQGLPLPLPTASRLVLVERMVRSCRFQPSFAAGCHGSLPVAPFTTSSSCLRLGGVETNRLRLDLRAFPSGFGGSNRSGRTVT